MTTTTARCSALLLLLLLAAVLAAASDVSDILPLLRKVRATAARAAGNRAAAGADQKLLLQDLFGGLGGNGTNGTSRPDIALDIPGLINLGLDLFPTDGTPSVGTNQTCTIPGPVNVMVGFVNFIETLIRFIFEFTPAFLIRLAWKVVMWLLNVALLPVAGLSGVTGGLPSTSGCPGAPSPCSAGTPI